MLFASLILSVAFVGCICVLIKAGGGDSSPPVIEYRQPDIHIHNNNNSHGGYSTSHGSSSDSTSNGGSSTSDSVSDSCSNNDNRTTDNISEEVVRQEIERLRAEFMKKQELDMRTLQELDRVSELLNNRK